MPIYEYRCSACAHGFERLADFSAANPECPSCGASETQKRLSTFASPSGTARPKSCHAPSAGAPCQGCPA